METRMKVVYDDSCKACTIGKNIAEHFDHGYAVKFVGMNTPEGKQLVAAHGLDMDQSAYALKGGLISDKRHMMCDVLAHAGIVGSIISMPFRIPYVGDKLYDLLALHRKHATTAN